MELILTHTNADFDALASMLGAYKLNPAALPLLPSRLNRNVAEFLTLYRSGLPFVDEGDFQAHSLVRRITLTDTQRAPEIKGLKPDLPTRIIDHHPLKRTLQPHEQWAGEVIGATTTLCVEAIQRQQINLNSLEATLFMLGIYEDTGMLTYPGTTPRDLRAAAWLLEQQADMDRVRRFLAHPLNESQQNLLEQLLSQTETRVIHGHAIAVSSASADTLIDGLNVVTHRLDEMIESAALFVIVEMPGTLQMVCRSITDAVDVGAVARLFGGGGHIRAAAARIQNSTRAQAVSIIWQQLVDTVRPVTTVAELMSYGAQTLQPDEALQDVIHHLRRIGHEGYPVVENGHIIGLLIRRDADRALEHGLHQLTVRDVMLSGDCALNPEDSVSALEQMMVSSGWGQIPVVQDGRLIGIVTRTDLIQHWARTHPALPALHKTLSHQDIENVLGTAIAALIEHIAAFAQQNGVTIYLVGGVVRDLLLNRDNLDIDFVIEGSAIPFARQLCDAFGGKIHSFAPFGTAKWLLDVQTASKLGFDAEALPDHLDFATARNEFYEHPTALPTVYSGSIKLDLQRRDFTINTLAIQLSPAAAKGRVLDFYGGLFDLEKRLIRVLHSLSFVDDPTRILRAVRFSERLQFLIEPRTSELILTGLPMLRRITGERVRNEITLLLREAEPERGILKLQAIGALEAIHPLFVPDQRLKQQFQSSRAEKPPWDWRIEEESELYWHLLLGALPRLHAEAICERLAIGAQAARSILDTSRLLHERPLLAAPGLRPSEAVPLLEGAPELALGAAWLLTENAALRSYLEQYCLKWRQIHPTADGSTLKQRGLRPGPAYKTILGRLRAAVLNGEVGSAADEAALLDRLIEEFGQDD